MQSNFRFNHSFIRSNLLLALMLSLVLSVSRSWAHALVFVHLGPKLPAYLPDALAQARLFNPDLEIYLLAEPAALTSYHDVQLNIKLISTATLQLTPEHVAFKARTVLNQGFWRYTSERFLYLADFIQQYNLSQVFHIENDNLLYCDLTQLLPIFQQYYPGVAAVLDADQRCIPSFIYFANPQAATTLAQYFVSQAQSGHNDMEVIARFLQHHPPQQIDTLPIISIQYHTQIGLKNLLGTTPQQPERYANHLAEFQSIFDGAALGQFIGGIDPQIRSCPEHGPGFINETCVFNPAKTEIFWQTDQQDRAIPYLRFAGETYRINNLHIHCKDLAQFRSLEACR